MGTFLIFELYHIYGNKFNVNTNKVDNIQLCIYNKQCMNKIHFGI